MKRAKQEIKAGVVMIIALFIFGSMAVLIGGARFWERLETYRIRFSAIGGLEPGAAVRLGGFRVGRVLTISVAREDIPRIEVTIGLKPGTPLYHGVEARINTLGLVGDYYVLLTQRGAAERPLPRESMIPSRGMMEMGDLPIRAADLSETLSTSVEKLVGRVDRILSEENIRYIRANLQSLSQLSENGAQSLKTLTTEVQGMIQQASRTLSDVDSLVVENRDDIRESARTFKALTQRLDRLSLTLNQAISENRDELRNATTAFRQGAQKATDLIDHMDNRVNVTGDYLEETMANLVEISDELKLLSSQLRKQPWSLIYRGKVKENETIH